MTKSTISKKMQGCINKGKEEQKRIKLKEEVIEIEAHMFEISYGGTWKGMKPLNKNQTIKKLMDLGQWSFPSVVWYCRKNKIK